MNANSDPLHDSWPSSAAISPLLVVRLFGFPQRAELSKHADVDKDSRLLVNSPKSLNLWLLLFIVNLGITYSAVGRVAVKTHFCTDFFEISIVLLCKQVSGGFMM